MAFAGSSAANAALPVGYDVQRIDSPTPATNGNFGLGFSQAGDVNGDGKQDILVGTDEHGGSTGPVFVISGADGSTLMTIPTPDADAGTTSASFGSYVGKFPDIGSCTASVNPGADCSPANVSTTPDGKSEMLVSALGQDEPGLADAGRGYVIDGATGRVLKRFDMPAADQTFISTTAPAGQKKPALGRTILNPSSQFGTANAPAPAAVQIGDMNGGGKPDVIVDASDFWENGTSANPQSECATSSAVSCLQAGRAYIYYGESWIGTDPAAIDNTPDMTIKNPAAQSDDLTQPVNNNRENLGYSIAPVGDLGQCPANPGPGARCLDAAANANLDGLPDVAISSHRTDDFGMMDAGVVPLFDGKTGAVLITYRHPEPQPASLFGFTNFNQPAMGDVGSGTAPDIWEPAMRENNPYTGGGKGYFMNGNFRQSGSPNSISFSTLTDPTPHPSEDFGATAAGIGNVFGDSRNEILVGAYGPHNPGTNPDVINDVHFMDPIHEVSLQDIQAPDQQPGLGFGTAMAPLGDLNGDGFLDFAVGAGLFDLTNSGSCSGGCVDAGRIYIFRSNNTPPATNPPPPTVVKSGRRLELDANPEIVRRGKTFKLIGRLDQFTDGTQCTAGQQVTIQQRPPGSLSYTTRRTVTSRADGTFATRFRARRTRVFRGLVADTDACSGDISNAVRVTVKRPRHRRHH